MTAPPLEGAVLPGLYVGEAGLGAALLLAGQVLGDERLIAAEAKGRLIAGMPHGSPDLFNGSAGRLRFHLLLHDATNRAEHLAAAVACGNAILSGAETTADGDVRWTIPSGYEDLSGNAYLGYAHGAAGIGDALLDLFEATGDERYLSAARAAGRWLARLATPALDDGSGLGWPDTEGGPPAAPLWCHGATGIGRFFLHLAELHALEGACQIAERAAWAAARGARWASPTQCHGLAGNIELLLDMAQRTGRAAWLTEARTLARLLEAFAEERDGALVFPSETPGLYSPDYMVGYAGVIPCLLRLSDPHQIPQQLSRRGFRRLPASPTGALPTPTDAANLLRVTSERSIR